MRIPQYLNAMSIRSLVPAVGDVLGPHSWYLSVGEPIEDGPLAVDDPVDTLHERFVVVLLLLLAHGLSSTESISQQHCLTRSPSPAPMTDGCAIPTEIHPVARPGNDRIVVTFDDGSTS